MGELSELTGAMCALKNVKEVELIGMPQLKKCVLMGGLKSVKSVKMENAGKLESVKGLKEVMEAERKRREKEERKKREEAERKRREEGERERREEEERRRREEAERKRREEERRKEEAERKKREEIIALAKTTVNVRNVRDLKNASISVRTVAIASNCCNDWGLSVLDLSRFVNLRELKVGDDCFRNVNEVKLIGLSQLESVVIGMNCFTEYKGWYVSDPNRHFYLKNCERLRELKMGRYSFSDYSVCEIENMPCLEVIEMGELNEESDNFWYASLNERSCNFYYASLELKSYSERME